MRRRDVLIEDFENIKILQQYLYMSEEHFVEVTNVLDVTLRITMGENLEYYCKNMNFPDVHASCWSSELTNSKLLSIIGQLKKRSATLFPERFDSRWDEIKELCISNLLLNSDL